MKLSEAMKALEEGKKIRMNTWNGGDYVDKNSNFTFCFPMHELCCWELYIAPVKTCSFAEALVLMKEGIKLRRPHFREYSAICIGKWGRIRWCSGDNFPISIQDIEADDWTIIL